MPHINEMAKLRTDVQFKNQEVDPVVKNVI
jgi:hypothetical protein